MYVEDVAAMASRSVAWVLRICIASVACKYGSWLRAEAGRGARPTSRNVFISAEAEAGALGELGEKSRTEYLEP